jgi:hypothetical protein
VGLLVRTRDTSQSTTSMASISCASSSVSSISSSHGVRKPSKPRYSVASSLVSLRVAGQTTRLGATGRCGLLKEIGSELLLS